MRYTRQRMREHAVRSQAARGAELKKSHAGALKKSSKTDDRNEIGGGTMPVEAAVRSLVKGIEHDEAMIIPGLKVKFTYWMRRVTPDRVWNAITDGIVARALRDNRAVDSPKAIGGTL